jgi:F-type H+-transporting ATPase subunit c
MDDITTVAIISIATAGFTITVGTIGPAYGQGRAVVEGLRSIARQPDEANTITRTLFVGMALIESFAIYCLVIAMVLLFFNPFWEHFSRGG